MTIVAKPWGHERIWAKTDKYVGKILFIKAGHSLSRQYHDEKDETFQVLTGELTLEIGWPVSETLELNEFSESFHCPPGTVHRMRARSDCRVLEISTPQLDDVVRLEDDYGR